MRLMMLTIFAMMLVSISLPAFADVGLADWCVNLNGNTISVCNGTSGSSTSSIKTGGFDETLEPGSNTLGSISFNIGTGAQYASVYMDYDVDFSTYGAFQDSGATNGTRTATASDTQSYELDDPNISNIFSDFASSSLTNTNNVGTYSPSPSPCCDVAWSLAESLNVNAALYSGGVVTFTVSTVAPKSGFYLSQTNGDTHDTIYLSDSVVLEPKGGMSPVPEPASIILFGTSALGALYLARRSRAVAL